jgi:3-methyladenine DNA glycosylase AlkD
MNSINSTLFVLELEETLKQQANEKNGIVMSKYMKDRFPFYGINSPTRKAIQQNWFKTLPENLTHESKWDIINELWEKEEREFHYIAIDWLNSWKIKEIEEDDSKRIEWLITNKSWWDSVDSIASNFLGKYCIKFPQEAEKLIEDWRHEPNIWLNRSCLIFQLKYKNKVDFELLKSLIKQYQFNKEFFIQKAIGWSLRQYSKFNKDAVATFVKEINLHGLARKEATKYL